MNPRAEAVEGDLRREDVYGGDPELAEWCAERWLAAHRSHSPAPDGLAETRVSLGREADARPAGYGASPGDELHPLPYLYVTP